MCLILFAWKSHPIHDLVLVANRDEFYNRPTQPAQPWEDYPELIAGKDLTANGTWLGITKSGRFAALTNYRDPANIDANAPSRGQLTRDFLESDIHPEEYLNNIKADKSQYNGFNLLVGDHDTLWYYNNVNHEILVLDDGIFGLSNALLNDSWPKVKKGKTELQTLIEQQNLTSEELLGIIQNKDLANDRALPKTGVPLEWERALSAMFISTETYGTRCSTAIIKNRDKTLFTELTYPHIGQKEGRVEYIL